jgi:hypothetical protein
LAYLDSIDSEGLRIILCLEFDPHAEPEQIAELKAALIDSPNTVHSVEATGDFDFMTEIAAPDLGWFNRWWKTLGRLFATVVRRCEKSFVCRRFIRRKRGDLGIWVRTGDQIKRIDHALVDKIVADGDYARVYSQGQSWLLHATMHSFVERLSPQQFVQLHRSVIVRSGFIDRLVHEGRHWEACLRDGTIERVAKSHVAETLRLTHSASRGADSSKVDPIGEPAHTG